MSMISEKYAEAAVIGGMVTFPQETEKAFTLLTVDMFANEFCKSVFGACEKLHMQGKRYDVITILAEIGSTPENKKSIVEAAKLFPHASGFEDYCGIVFENWRKRELISAAYQVANSEGTVKEMLNELQNIVDRQAELSKAMTDSSSLDFKAAIMRYMDFLLKPDNSIKTGWKHFDDKLGGFQRKGFYVISARSGMGKTDYALNLACVMALRYRVGYMSMEMSAEQLLERVASRAGMIDSKLLLQKDSQAVGRATEALGRIMDKTQLVTDYKQRLTVNELEAKIVRNQFDVVFVDHIGLMGHKEFKSKWEGIADTSQRLKELAMKHNMVIIALVQEQRGAEGGKSSMSALKGSDNITNDADGIFQIKSELPEKFLSGDECIPSTVTITKNRHSGTGQIQYSWQPQYHRWTAVDTSYQ